MKDARTYEKKVKKLLSGRKQPQKGKGGGDPIAALIEAVMEANASAKHAAKAMSVFEREFVDFNELRVAQPREITELLGKGFPHARQKAEELTGAMNRIFFHINDMSMEYMASMTKRDLRRHLSEIGLSPYAAGRVVLSAFDGHAIPVDEDLAETMAMDGHIPEGTSVSDLQGFLERIIPQKDAWAAHVFFRQYVESRSNALTRKRKADETARLAAERKAAEEAKKAADKAAVKEAEKAANEKAKKAAAKKAAKKVAKKAAAKKAAKKVAKKAAAKKVVKKAVKKTVKKTVKKAAKKGVRKAARKAAKKAAKKRVRKAAKKVAKKAAKRAAKRPQKKAAKSKR
ncbi:MAG: hypothetical protein ACYS8X_07725 [Planctomycetota bacterium]|jgi:hypothetical protein